MNSRMRPLFRVLKRNIAIVLVALTTLALAVSNLDMLATIWTKHFGQSSEIAALEEAINVPQAPPAASAVEVELVQRPHDQSDSQVFDVFFKNTSSDDLLLTSLTYGKGFVYTSVAMHGSEKFFPDSSYSIAVKDGSKLNVALSPPFLLKASSRAGIRFSFDPEARSSSFASTTLAFEVYDSTGKKVAAVNGLLGN